MSSNGVGASKLGRHRIVIPRWVIRVLIALILSVLIAMLFFHSGAISR